MPQRLPLVMVCSLALFACSEQPETLQFKPDDGENRRYQMFSEISIEATSSYGSNSERVRSHMFMDYDVEEASSTYDILMQPRYLRTRFRRGSGGFSSTDEPSYGQEELHSLMESGFTMVVDKQSGEPSDFIIHHHIDRLEDDGFDPIGELLQDEISRPGYPSGILLEVGATHEIPSDDDVSPDVTLTVKELHDDAVTLTMQGENEEVKLYGYMLLERETGWLKRSALIVDMPLQHEYTDGHVRMFGTVIPADDWQFGEDLEFFEDDAQGFPIDTSAQPDSLDDMEMADVEKVFPTRSGNIDYFDSRLTLEYVHDVFDSNSLGHIEISDFQALDKNGDALDITLHGLSAFSFNFGDGEPMRTHVDVYPLGWSDTAKKLEQLGAIEGTVKRFPVTHEVVDLLVEENETVLEHHGARAVLTPTEEDGVYRLKLAHSENAYFGAAIDGPSDGIVEYDRAENTPAWLDGRERGLLEVIRQGYYPRTHTLYFEDERPDAIRLMTHLIGDEPMDESKVRFYDPDAALSNIELEPMSSTYLFFEYPDYAMPSHQGLEFQVDSIDEVEPVSFGRPQLYLTLTQEQAALCELEQASGTKEAGRALTWRENDPRGQYVQRELSLPQEVVYQLTTEDGVREFFYEHEVALSMVCDGEPEWETLHLDLGEHSWLVEVAELLGDDWAEAYGDMLLADFLRRYRFLDGTGAALTLVPPPDFDGQQRADFTRLTVNEFVTQEGFLRIAGRVDRIEKLQASGEAFTREWQHQFPPLPSTDAPHQG
ncbi:hypothetical protein [Aquisalimonas asiatica]|uniref:Lipoprotein n=1 Tax=Aquisalimonas asiatica TaxID=406100 RepID=A0A1H8S615_9GAMM|nr:hypothetical protein [Aquisalimonas asiatica]SEO73603.1 hypothetical protein SAMN04488052_102486 [Aquisalimonas asiatica]